MRMDQARRLGRAALARAAVGAALVGTLAAGGPAAAATGYGRQAVAENVVQAAAAGTVSTVAGGAGGPGLGTKVALTGTCGVMFRDGYLYASETAPYYQEYGDQFSTVRQVSLSTGQLSTPVGNYAAGTPTDLGPADRATLEDACGVASGPAGMLVLTQWDPDMSRVLVVAGGTGTYFGRTMIGGHIYNIAGSGTSGYSGDGRLGTRATLYEPEGVAVDSAGNALVADTGNGRVRVLAMHDGTFYGQGMSAGHIYTIAGDGSGTFSGNGIPATSEGLYEPSQIALDSAGNVVLAADNRILVMAASTGVFYGQAMTAGDMYTIGGTGTAGHTGDGSPAISAELDTPWGTGLDAAGNVLLSEYGDGDVRVIAENNGSFYGQAMAAGDIYTIAGNGTAGFSGDGGPATGAELSRPLEVSTDSAGNVLVADSANRRVRVIAESTGRYYGQQMTAGDIYTVAGDGAELFSGDGGPATHAELDIGPSTLLGSVGTDSAGDVLIADASNERVRMIPAASGTYYGRAMTAGNIYTVAGDGTKGFSGDGGPAIKADLSLPTGVTVDHAGNLVVADLGNNRIRVVAARTGTYYGRKMVSGRIYTVAGDGAFLDTGNGGLATNAGLSDPAGVAVDGAGNLFIADTYRIRVVAAASGTLYGHAVTAGHIYEVAGDGKSGREGNGGPAGRARLDQAISVAVDGAGNVIIADQLNSEVRVVAASTGAFYGQAMTAGDIYNLAGARGFGYGGDGGPATSATLNYPAGVAVDGMGNVLIADRNNDRIRVVAGSTGTFYGQAMTDGYIYTVAGVGTCGWAGDGGPATSAEFCLPNAVAVDGAGDLVIADDWNDRIREVTG